MEPISRGTPVRRPQRPLKLKRSAAGTLAERARAQNPALVNRVPSL